MKTVTGQVQLIPAKWVYAFFFWRNIYCRKDYTINRSWHKTCFGGPKSYWNTPTKNYFANASLLRNLVLHYSFHLKTPQWKLTTRELIRSVGRRRVRPSRCRAGSSPLVSTTPTRYWGLLVISDPKKLLLWCERNASSGLNAKVWTLFITMLKWEFL